MDVTSHLGTSLQSQSKVKGNINIIKHCHLKSTRRANHNQSKKKKKFLYKVPEFKFLIHFDINGPTSRRWKTRAVSRVTEPFFKILQSGAPVIFE